VLVGLVAGTASALLERQLASAPLQRAAELAGSVAQGASAAAAPGAPERQWWVLREFGAAAEGAFRGYSAYITQTPAAWMAQASLAGAVPGAARLLGSKVLQIALCQEVDIGGSNTCHSMLLDQPCGRMPCNAMPCP
jgi:hypothetical protein